MEFKGEGRRRDGEGEKKKRRGRRKEIKRREKGGWEIGCREGEIPKIERERWVRFRMSGERNVGVGEWGDKKENNNNKIK